MKNTTTPPAWFFRFFVVITIIALIPLGFLYFDFITHPLAPDPGWGSVVFRLFMALAIVPAGLIVSVLVLRRTQRNVTGLFLLMYTVSLMQSTLRSGFSVEAFPLLPILSRFSDQGLWLLPLYFPDGAPYPPRFRRWPRLHSVVMVLLYLCVVFFYPTIGSIPGIHQPNDIANPLFIPALLPIREAFSLVQGWFWITSILFIVPSIILRFRASRGIVRKQIEWFVSVFAILIIVFLLLGTQFVNSKGGPLDLSQFGILGIFVLLYQAVFVPVAPLVAVGVAILRHRLYDIEIIIRRTLVYSVLTAILAVIYFGGVIVVQQLLRPLTESSDLAIVISTLLIAALFTPLRRRVQNTIDHRFYRRKYDAEQTLAHFNQTLRDEVDMETLKAHLVGVIQDTMQPTKAALWMPQRPTGVSSNRETR